MIWQLLKRDPAWPAAFWMAPVGAAAGVFLNFNAREAVLLVVPLVGLYMTVARQRATLFTAALPVPARCLFLVRVAAILAVLWIPAATAAAVFVVLGKPLAGVGDIAEAALFLTAAALIALSLRPREFSAPASPVALIALLLVGGAFRFVDLAPAGILGAGSALVSVLLFWRTWTVIPPSFQAAPPEVRGGTRRSGSARPPAFVWWPVLRTVVPVVFFFMWPAMLLQPGPNQWLSATLLAFFPLVGGVTRSHWALALPVSRSTLLGIMLGFSIAPVLIGYLGRLLFPSATESARAVVLTVAACLCIFLIAANGLVISLHHRVRRLPRAVKGLCLGVALIPYLAFITDSLLNGGGQGTGIVNRFLASASVALPANLALVFAAALIPVLLLLWSAFRLFAGMELPGVRPPTVWEALNRG